MAKAKDTRVQERCTYAGPSLLWTGLLLYLGRMGARRQINYELDTPAAVANLNRLSGDTQERAPDHGTLAHYLSHVLPTELPRLRRWMIRRLIRMKALDHARLFGYFLVAVDGTEQLRFTRRHCPHCLEQTVHGQKQYYHTVLEAKLVTPDGYALSLASEFIENVEAGADKQDCELKAFHRLAQRLKRDFPQLRICLLLDGLFANGPVMTVCERNRWKYITVFKEGSLPAVWDEFVTLLGLAGENRLVLEGEDREQAFGWVEGLELIDEQKRRHVFDALQCVETEAKSGKTTRFAWITNFRITPETVRKLANRGGRLRWKIENEGFNIQKNGGANLEHAYSGEERAGKNFYLLMQIAHIIEQVMDHATVLGASCRKVFGSLKNMCRRLLDAFRYLLLPAEDALPEEPALPGRAALVFDTS